MCSSDLTPGGIQHDSARLGPLGDRVESGPAGSAGLIAVERSLGTCGGSDRDVLVVGGGIHGAAVAWVATLAGLKVGLVERGDFAGATSAQSQKIIHGGLRYLQDLDIRRSLQSIRDRARLFRIAPHLAHPLACLIPLEGYGMRGPEVMRAGLLLYRVLSAMEPCPEDPSKRLPHPGVLPAAKLRSLIGGVPAGNARGAAVWSDGCVHHTERLVVGLIRSACRAGATAANYAEAVSTLKHDGRVCGIEVEDRLGGGRTEHLAPWTVDCSGPWEGCLTVLPGRSHRRRVGGLNLVTRPIHPQPVAVGVRDRSGDGSRFYFVSPWRGGSIVGTEWFRHEAAPEEFRPTEERIARMLAGFNRAWPAAGLRRADILHVHCGTVPADDRAWDRGEDAPMLAHSRVIDRAADGLPGLISVVGVKYTTALSVAEEVVRRIRPGFRLSPAGELPQLAGGAIPDWAAFEREGRAAGIAEDLLRDYGTEAAAVAGDGRGDVGAMVRHAVEHEMAVRLEDVVFRRTGLAARGRPDDRVIREAAGAMAARLQWDEARTAAEIGAVESTPAWPGAASGR